MSYDSFIEWIFKGFIAFAMTLAAFITKNLHTEIVKIRDKQNSLDGDFRDHKLEAEKRYAKEETLQSSLSRVHQRIDRMDETLNLKLDKIHEIVLKK